MELTQKESELSRWAAEEMEVPLAAHPLESMLRRLCLSQCADIWAYIVQHVRSQRNIKTIQGNLLWHAYQDNPKIHRKAEACYPGVYHPSIHPSAAPH
uniref:Uncharacterized protein n=1 Tax=Mus spicilegus TaxID=10103 RepID=A0A8C6MSD0_MUSSI